MDELVRAKRAADILNDEVLLEAFSVVEDTQVGVFKYPNSSSEDIMEAHRMVRALGALRDQLQAFVDAGKVAARRK